MCRRPVPAVIATPPSLGEAPTDPYLVRPDPSVPQLDTDRSRLTRPPGPPGPAALRRGAGTPVPWGRAYYRASTGTVVPMHPGRCMAWV